MLSTETHLTAPVPGGPQPRTVAGVSLELIRDPWHALIVRWNWKSALFSSLIRANIFFFVTLRSGWRAALGAFTAELGYRVLTSGFYGALTQSFSGTEPAWAGALTVMILLPLSSHTIEFAVHSIRHTPHLVANIMTSVGFTVVSSLFNWSAMRKGSLIVGPNGQSIGKDMQSMPRLILSFVTAGPIAICRFTVRRLWPPDRISIPWDPVRLHESENSSSD